VKLNIFLLRNQTWFFPSTLLLVFIAVLFAFWNSIYHQPLIPRDGQPMVYTFAKGGNSATLATDLEKLQLIHHPHFFVFTARLLHKAHRLQAGEYQFEPGITEAQLLDKINRGQVIQYSITFVEGWTFADMLAQLAKTEPLIHEITKQSPAEVLQALGPAATDMEGWYYPDTYYFVRGSSDAEILKKANIRMHEKLLALWKTRAPGLIYRTPEEALIVASLIEKEASDPVERPIVASVILHRLHLNMPLQIDASVIYGLGQQYDGTLHHNDLAIDTPYNTYLHRDLPPTPIAMPNESSIKAALHPSAKAYLYYVAKGDGHHYFSYTLEEHNQAVARYQLKQSFLQVN
jgi:UPF0755 protein